jgi:hypothetical protein
VLHIVLSCASESQESRVKSHESRVKSQESRVKLPVACIRSHFRYQVTASISQFMAIPNTQLAVVETPHDGAGRRGTSLPLVPILEVAFRHDMWWSLPVDMSARLLEHYENNQDAVYTWDWGDARTGSFCPNGETTNINRYRLNFETWEQENIDNGRRRSVRFVWTITGSVQPPRWTGEMGQ